MTRKSSRPLIVTGAALAAGVAIGACRRIVRRSFEEEHARRFTLSPDGIVHGAEPIALDASPTHAVLILHGFNDTPQSVSSLAAALHAAGWTVRVPLLPGHGSTLSSMAAGRARTWRAHARAALDELRATHETVALCGQSMGAALAVQLAVEHPDIPALVLLAPFIGVPRALSAKFALSWLLQSLFPYRVSTGGERSIHDPAARALTLGKGVVTARVLRELQSVARGAEAALPHVQAPALYMQSVEDNRIRAEDAERNFARLGSRERVQRWLTGCGHVIAADYHRDEVAQQTIEWITRWAGAPAKEVPMQPPMHAASGGRA
jgi:carboxylesterase